MNILLIAEDAAGMLCALWQSSSRRRYVIYLAARRRARDPFDLARSSDTTLGHLSSLKTGILPSGSKITSCAVVCWEGQVLAGVGCEAVGVETPVGPATVVRLVDNAEMMGAALKIARRLCLSGFIGLDFMIEEGTGTAYLIEMNPRCTPLCHLRLGIKRDMIGALYERLTGKPIIDPVLTTQNNLIAYFPQALLRNSELLASSYH